MTNYILILFNSNLW